MTLQEANNVLEQAAQQDVKLGVIKWVFDPLFIPISKLILESPLSRFCVYKLRATFWYHHSWIFLSVVAIFKSWTMPLVRQKSIFLFLSVSNVYQFIYFETAVRREKLIFLSLCSLHNFFTIIRFDDVDEANPAKKPTIHEILLEGKRKTKMPFEDELRAPCGKLTNEFSCLT